MGYPLISEYVEAVKSAEDNFEQLKCLRPVLGYDGEPVMSSGNFAVVFKMKNEHTGKFHAVKCFLREQEGRAEAYQQIAEELEFVNSTFLTPIKYLEKELFVDTNTTDETEFPVLLMDWVEGQTIEQLLNNHPSSDEIYDIAFKFSKFALWLLSQPFAHGDLKPDNIIIKRNGEITLVDYDGMFVPAMEGKKARENGTPNYRDPMRHHLFFDEHIDDFSLVIIELSLLLISKDYSLFQSHLGDALIFTESDLLQLKNSKIYKDTSAYRDNVYIRELYSLLEKLLDSHTIQKTDVQCLRIPPKQQWDDSIKYSVEATTILSDFLWKVKEKDYIRDVNLSEGIFEIRTLDSGNNMYLRICKGDSPGVLVFLVYDGNLKGFSSIKKLELKKMMLSMEMWDESVDNKIEILNSL